MENKLTEMAQKKCAEWVLKANKEITTMEIADQYYLLGSLVSINRKKSKRLAMMIAEDFANFLNLDNPLEWGFVPCLWDGINGYDVVLQHTFFKIYLSKVDIVDIKEVL